jgi:hypothetical protein
MISLVEVMVLELNGEGLSDLWVAIHCQRDVVVVGLRGWWLVGISLVTHTVIGFRPATLPCQAFIPLT